MTEERAGGRLPPNQALMPARRWPVIGESAPRNDPAPWMVTVGGLVGRDRCWTLEDLRGLTWLERAVDIHCVTRWSKLGMAFGGVRLRDLLDAAQPRADARFVRFVARSTRDHASSLPLADLPDLDPLVALTVDGEPLPVEHGGPVRLIVPGHYAIRAALEGDDQAFAEEEMRFRRVFHYPPFTRLVLLLARHKSAARAEGMMRDLARRLTAHPLARGVRVSGPARAPLERLRGKWRFQMLLRGPSGNRLRQLVRAVVGDQPPPELVIDVDPYDLM